MKENKDEFNKHHELTNAEAPPCTKKMFLLPPKLNNSENINLCKFFTMFTLIKIEIEKENRKMGEDEKRQKADYK